MYKKYFEKKYIIRNYSYSWNIKKGILFKYIKKCNEIHIYKNVVVKTILI